MAGTTEIYATAEDGASLKWDYYEAVGTPKAVVLLVHGGGFRSGNRATGQVAAPDLIAAGYHVLSADYRLAPNGHITGQTSDGRYPDQVNDIKRAVLAIRADGRFTGLPIFGLGGSAGGTHLSTVLNDNTTQVSPVAWDTSKRIDAIVGLSGVYGFVDRTPYETAEQTWSLIRNYCGTSDLDTEADFLILEAAEPLAFVESDSGPIMNFNSSTDTVPTLQAALMDAAYLAAGATDNSSFLVPIEPGGGVQHAFDYWSLVKTQVIAWYDALVEGGGTPPPPPPGTPEIIHGVSVGTPSGVPIDQAILDNPDIDAIGLNAHWYDLEVTEGVFDYDYLDTEIHRIAAAGKRCVIRVTTMGGSYYFSQGNTPNWVFTAIGNTDAGNDRDFLDAVVTNGSPTVTSATANFRESDEEDFTDLFKPISGNGIPSNTYIGVITSSTEIGLSSSNVSNVPVNATGDVDPAVIHLTARPRVAYNTHDTVPGATFDYVDPNPQHTGDPQTTIPVYWEPTFLAKKKRMLNALGDHITNGTTLTQAEKSCVAVIGIAFANAQTEDWNVPADNTIDEGKVLSLLDLWINPIDDDDPALSGAGYTTQKMIDAAVLRVGQSFTDGQTFTDTRLKSSTAIFTFADVGKPVTGTNIVTGTKITSWTANNEVALDTATTGTGTLLPFAIGNRDVGVFDVAVAAFPGQLVTSAIGSNAVGLDQAAAQAAGDTDVANYLARTVYSTLNAKYPGRVIAQKNNVSANYKDAPGKGSQKLLFDIHAAGNYVAGQALWFCFMDPTYRMNGGSSEDKDNPGIFLTDGQILERSGVKLSGFGANYYEIYNKDAINLLSSVAFLHDLFTGPVGPPPPPPPEPFPVPGSADPPSLSITASSFRDDVIYHIADLLNIDYAVSGAPPIRARRWARSINRHVAYAWRLYRWPELILTEERAFAPIWNATKSFPAAVVLYYLGTYDDDNVLQDLGYYRTLGIVPAGILPTDTIYFEPYTLTARDYFIPMAQGCRQRLGDVYGVYPYDPRLTPLNYSYTPLNWRKTNRGIEIVNWQSGGTVFVRYRVRPYEYTSEAWASTTSYPVGALVIWTDGEVYRAIAPVSGVIPPNDATRWAHIPFPEYFSQYASYMAAADDADDKEQADSFRKIGMEFLDREMDALWVQDTPTTYDFGRMPSINVPQGTSGFLWSIWPVAPSSNDGITTISDKCLDEWGSIIP